MNEKKKGSQKSFIPFFFVVMTLKKGSNSILFFVHSVCDLLAQNYVNFFPFILIKSMIFIQFDRKTSYSQKFIRAIQITIFDSFSSFLISSHFISHFHSFSWLRLDIKSSKSITIFDNRCLNSGRWGGIYSVEWES